MRNSYKYLALLFSGLLGVTHVAAEENIGSSGKTSSVYKSLAVDCSAASASIEMDINNVRTTLLNGGDMWWNLNEARYEVPKVDATSGAASVNSLFAGAIWLGGIDAGGQLKIAAQTYRQSGNDFWPGPLDATASTNAALCESYDRHWEVFGADIDLFRGLVFPTTEQAIADLSPTANLLLEWPAKGNQRTTGANGVLLNINEDLAPFYDNDNDGLYDPTQGDFPVINTTCDLVYADQMIYWVYNDKGNVHSETGGQAIGVQVGALAFAFATSDEVNNMTFYRYDILNKATSPINDFYMGQWVDADLGCFNNDFVGCDTALGLGYVYNGTGTDPDCGSRGYGTAIPILGVDYFEGPFADLNNGIDDDGDGLIDEGTNGLDDDGDGVIDNIEEREKLGMSTFTYYNNDFTLTGNPETAVHYYNYMVGFWKDGTPFTSDRCDAKGGAVPTTYMFPSDPDGAAFPSSWSECSCNNVPADRRWLQASGPFTLTPGARNFITVGAVWVRQSSQSTCLADIDLLRSADLKAQALFDNCFKLVDGPDAPDLVIRELDKEIIIYLTNAPTSNNFQENYNEIDPLVRALSVTNPAITDTTYTFQGYKIYQLKSDQVGADQLDDPTLARLIAQVDVKDGIGTLINKTFVSGLCAEVPSVRVEGEDNGISKSFQVKSDLFASGTDASLVNHQTYFFTAIAYAYNYFTLDTFQQITTDCGLLPVVQEQKTPYLQGRKNFKTYNAIPHKYEGAQGGTVLNAEFGDRLDITRLEGAGNGGFQLVLTDESIDNIMADGAFFGPVVYKGGNAPIDVKVVDPYKLPDMNFTLTFFGGDTIAVNDTLAVFPDTNLIPVDTFVRYYTVDTLAVTPWGTKLDSSFTTQFIVRSARWFVTTDDGDTIFAEKSIDVLSERILEEYGLSVSLNQVDNVGKDWWDAPADIGFLGAEIEFADSSNQWLTGVADASTGSFLNWIRSGQYKEGAQAEQDFGNFFDDHYLLVPGRDFPAPAVPEQVFFYDPFEQFEAILGSTWAPYCLGANSINGALVDGANSIFRSIYTFGPAFSDTFRFQTQGPDSRYVTQPRNTLENLQSFTLVLTPDKTKWTKCVVVEMGEDITFNEGGALKGHLRQAPSKDINGNDISTEVGRSWFPGYAINLETGERLNMMFGEDSDLASDRGRDMIWNPTSSVLSPLGQVLFGGRHNIYIMDSRYDGCDSIFGIMSRNFNNIDTIGTALNQRFKNVIADSIYNHIMWVTMPTVTADSVITDWASGLVPTEVEITIRVRKPFERFVVDSSNDGLPKYWFSTEGMGVDTALNELAEDFLDQIRAVPNPYYAYSTYENDQIDNRIKVINLPKECTITVYSIDGTLIRRFERGVGSNTHDGSEAEKANLDSSIDWDLKNTKGVPIASGVYLIHVEAPGLGEKTIKWFGIIRPLDLTSF